MSSTIPNYSIPGVYVTQSGTALNAISTSALNIALVADVVVTGTATDNFYAGSSGINIIGYLSNPMYASGTAVVSGINGGTVISGVLNTNYKLVTNGSTTYISTSGLGTASLSGNISVNYQYNFGGLGTYTSYTQLANVFGVPTSGTTVTSPVSLAAYLAFQNGANTVSVQPVARVSGVTYANTSDWIHTFTPVTSGSDPTYLSSFVGVDVVVPLYGFLDANNSLISYGTGTVASGINNYLNTQASNGAYQRAFLGLDGTSNTLTASGVQTLANAFGNNRVSLVYPGTLTYNPGVDPVSGSINTNINVPGYYLAAAVAGVFVGQPNVATPITNKQVAGFTGVPNQISASDAATSYLEYGILTVRQKRDGNLWILHGLTTDTSSWTRQEVSISAIGDVLAQQISRDLNNSQIIGSAMTKNTVAATIGIVQSSLTTAVSNSLIQSYNNLEYFVYNSSPTTINIVFQYAPTYPINYIKAVLSLNTQTGQVNFGNSPSNLVTY